MDLPNINQIYDCYDDGKIRESRRYQVKVKDIIPFDKAPEDILEEWDSISKYPGSLFASATDYFIIADSYEQENIVTTEVFARTVDGGWFGLGDYWNCGLLIIK